MDSRRNLLLQLIVCAIGIGYGFVPRIKLADPHIVGGTEVDIREIPYMASIRLFLNHDCGSSIIGKYYALTAAHCFIDRQSTIWYGVAAGSNHVRQGSYHIVRSITVHPKYNIEVDFFDYDVAIVKIWFGFKFSEKIDKIIPVDSGTKLDPKSALLVSGWGKTSEFAPTISDKLLKTDVQVIDKFLCKQYYYDFQLTDRMFCAGVEDGQHDACTSDSGGPIVDMSSGKQVGIVSWGVGCANPIKPGVYTDLSDPEIRQFIESSVLN